MSSNSPAASHPVPKPVSAYVGLLLAAVEDTNEPGASLVARVARLPIATFGQLLSARRRYDELAQQGDLVIDALVGMVRHRLGGSAEDAEELYDDDADLSDDSADWIADDFASPTRADAAVTSITGRANGSAPGPFPGSTDDELDDELDDEPDEEDAPEPTPLEQIEAFQPPAELQEQAGDVVSHDQLPLPDFDHMTAPQLRGRLRRLDQVSLVQLLDYERAHAHRLPIVLMLENRLTKLIETGDESGSPQQRAPETPAPSSNSGPVMKPGPAQNPPSQGDPTNPAQPR